LVAMALDGEVNMAVVGSEVVLRGDLPLAELIALIASVRSRIPASIPVAYADVYSVLLEHPELIVATDVVFSNHYPYWEGIDAAAAVRELSFQYLQLVAVAGARPVVISETGWPSGGNAVGLAIPSLANAANYLLEFVSWARANGVSFYYFEAFDEAWKSRL